jgi:hypothetical protein
MDAEKSKSRKKPDVQELLVEGEYVDVYCYQSKRYKLAIVLNVSDGEVEVGFVGTYKRSLEVS